MSQDIEERLAAWLDGALTPEEARHFEAEMASDPDLAAKAASWKANDSFLAGAFAPLAEAQFDQAALERMGLSPQHELAAANDNPPWWRRSAWPLAGGAIAAGLALVLLVTGRPNDDPDGLNLALDTTPSLKQVRLADGRSIEPRLTVRAADGRWCREFASGGKVALACRGDRGWQVVGEATDASAAATPGEVVLAGGPDGTALDAAYALVGASDPVDGREEARLIAGHWKR